MYIVFGVVFAGLFAMTIMLAKLGKASWIKIRALPALEALRDSVGRCTEMGKSVIINPGEPSGYQTATMGPAENIAHFIAGNALLSYIAGMTAKNNVKLLVPISFADTIAITQETVRAAYIKAGKESAFDVSNIYFVASQDAAMNAYMNDLVIRERPGLFVTFAVSGTSFQQDAMAREVGAIVIGGVARVSQLGPKIALCDYVLMGDELYTAGAYVSGDQSRISTVLATDIVKGVFVTLMIAGKIAITAGSPILWNLFKA